MMMKGCVQRNPIYSLENVASSKTQTKDRYISRPADLLGLLSGGYKRILLQKRKQELTNFYCWPSQGGSFALVLW